MFEPSNYSYFPYKPIIAIAKVDASMVIFETSIQRLNDLTPENRPQPRFSGLSTMSLILGIG